MTENGCAVADDDVKVAKNDTFRVEFYQGPAQVVGQAPLFMIWISRTTQKLLFGNLVRVLVLGG